MSDQDQLANVIYDIRNKLRKMFPDNKACPKCHGRGIKYLPRIHEGVDCRCGSGDSRQRLIDVKTNAAWRAIIGLLMEVGMEAACEAGQDEEEEYRHDFEKGDT